MSDLRTRKTLSSLKNAFLSLLEQYRFEEITVRQLCDRAQIRRATFYTHFADKYEFLTFFIHEIREELVEHIEQLDYDLDESADAYYDGLFHELILFFEEHPMLVRNLKNSSMLTTIMEIFAEYVQKNVYSYLQSRSEEDDRMMEMKACFYTGGILQLLQLWMKDPEQFPVDEINWLGLLM